MKIFTQQKGIKSSRTASSATWKESMIRRLRGTGVRMALVVAFVLAGLNLGYAVDFSATLSVNQKFKRPNQGTVLCGNSSYGVFTSTSAGSTDYVYATQSFTVATAGDYVINVTSSTASDPMLFVYTGSFNASSPLTNFKVGDDDATNSLNSKIDCQNHFDVGTYVIVVSTYSSSTTSGVVNFSVTGGGAVNVLPTVTTSAASGIGSTSATLSGNVSSDGGASVDSKGVAYSTSQNPTAGTSSGSGTGAISQSATGLSMGTTYYARAWAHNSVGTAYGPQVSFTTLSSVSPSVTTGSIGSITQNSATCGGNVTSDGGSGILERGIVWGTSPSPTGNKITDGGTTGTINPLSITGLSQSTRYYVRAFARNSVGTSYGSEQSFVTNHIVNYSAGANGSISGTTSQSIANGGNGTAVTAVPNANYSFLNWSDGSTTNPRPETNVTSSKTLTANFTINRLAFNPQPSNTVAGQNIPFTVRIVDSYGNTMTNSDQVITIAMVANPGSGTLAGTLTLTADHGVVSSSNVWINKTGNGYTLSASAGSLTGATSGTFNITPAAIDHFTVTGITSPVVAGTTTTPVVTAYDQYNNIKTNYIGTIAFSSDDPQAVLPANYPFVSGNNGTKTFTNGVTLKTTVTRSVTVTGDTKTGTQSGITVNPAVINHWTLETVGSVTAGTEFSVIAKVYDQYGNLKTDYNGSHDVSWTSTAISSLRNNPRELPADGPQTFNQGVATIGGFKFYNSNQSLLDANTSHWPTITVTDGPSAIAGTTAPITVTNAGIDNFLVVAGTTETAGVTFPTTVTARDRYWNTHVTYTGTVRFKSSLDGVSHYAPDYTYLSSDHGVKLFTGNSGSTRGVMIERVGNYWIRVAEAADLTKNGSQQGIIVGPGAFDPASSFTVDNTSRVAGEFVRVTLIPKDANGNLLCPDKSLISVKLDGATSDYNGEIVENYVMDAQSVPQPTGTYTADVRVTSTTAPNIITAYFGGVLFTTIADITVSHAPASKLAISTQPQSSVVAGVAFSPQPAVQIQDEFNNVITTGSDATGTITVAKAAGSGSGDLLGTLTKAAAGGVATFSGLNIQTIGDYYLEFSYGSFAHVTSSAVAITHAAANKLDIYTQPSSSGIAGVVLSAQPVVRILDIYGNLVTTGAGAATHVIAQIGDKGTNTLVGTLDITAGSGIATFTNIKYNKAETINIKFTDGSLTDITSNDISITHNSADHLAIATQPAPTAIAGQTFTTQPVINIQDAYGNLVNTGAGAAGSITVSKASGPAGGVLGGSSAVTASNGVAAFGDLITNTSGTYTLNFTKSGIAGVVSDNVVVSPAAPTSQFTISDVTTMVAGARVQYTVTRRDMYNNPTIVDDQVVNLASNSSGNKLFYTSAAGGTAVSSVTIPAGQSTVDFWYYDTKVSAATTITASATSITSATDDIAVTHAAANKLAILTQPQSTDVTAGVAFAPQPAIQILDQFDNLVTTGNDATGTITVAKGSASNGSGSLLGTATATASGGIATFSGLHINITGDYYLEFSYGEFSNVTSTKVKIVNETIPVLAQSTISASHASSIRTDESCTITVQLKDQYGNNLIAGGSAVTMGTDLGSISAVSDNGNGTYTATLTGKLGGGTNGTGTATITAHLAAASKSTTVAITEGIPDLTQILVTASASSITADQTSTVTVQLKDKWGNNITHSQGTVTLANTPIGHLTAVTDHNDGTYTATFSLTASGTGTATITGNFTGALDAIGVNGAITDDATVNVSPGAATKLAMHTQPSATATAGVTFGQQPVIYILDQHDNLVTSDNSTVVTAARSGGTAALFSTGSLTATASGGIVTFSGLNYHKAEAITLGFSSGSLTSATSNSIVVSANTASYLAITGAGTQVAGASQNITVTAYDTYDNVATGYTGDHALTFTGAGASPAPSTLPTVAGSPFALVTLNFTGGIATGSMILYRAETAQVTASAGAINSNSHTLSVVVSPAPTAYFTLNSPADITAGGARAAYTVTRYDQYNNPRIAGTDRAYLYTTSDGTNAAFYNAASAGSAITYVDITNGNSSAGFWYYDRKTSWFGPGSPGNGFDQSWSVTASDNASAADGTSGIDDATDNIKVLPAALAPNPNTFSITTTSNTFYYGDWQTFTVKALDIYGNVKTNYLGKVTFSVNPSDATQFPDDQQFVVSDYGTHTFTRVISPAAKSLYFHSANSYWVTVLDQGNADDFAGKTFNVLPRPITITATGQNKTYGDTKDLGTSAFTITSGDLAAGESISSVILSSDGAANTGIAGDHPIIPSGATGGGGFLASNYSITWVNGNLAVAKKELTVNNAAAQNKNYNGNNVAVISGATLVGVESWDNVSLANQTTGIFGQTNIGTDIAVTPSMTITGTGIGNYTLTQPTGLKANITAVQLTPVIVANDKPYDGNTTATLSSQSVTGMVNSETAVTLVVGASNFDTKDKGTNKTVTATTLSLSGAASGNYVLASGATATDNADITPVQLTPHIVANDKPYDGNTTATLSSQSVTGMVNNETAVTLVVGASNFDTKDKGTDKTVTATTLSLGGAASGNYVLASGATATDNADITPVQLTPHIVANDKPYDGNTTATLSSQSVTGMVNSETAVTLVVGASNFDTKDKGTNKTVTATTLSLGGAASGNYVLASGATATDNADITPVQLTPHIVANDRLYNGSTTATLSAQSVSGYVLGETVTLGVGAANFDTKNVGTNKTVTASALTLGGVDAGNYVLATGATATDQADISAKPITGNFTADNKVYDGNRNAVIHTRTLNDVETIDNNKVILTGGTATFSDKNVANGKTVTPSGMTLAAGSGGDESTNYSLTSVATTTADITVRTLTLSNFGANNKVYDGTTVATGIGFNDDRLTGDNLAFTRDAAFDNPNVGTTHTVHYSNIVISGGTDKDNYVLASTTGNTNPDIVILGVPITVTANAKHKAYGTTLTSGADSNPADYTVSGLPGGITVGSVTMNYGTGAVATDAAATYTGSVTPSGATGGTFVPANYTITYVSGNIVVDKAPLTIAAVNHSKEYGSTYTFNPTTPPTDFTVTGLVNGNTVTGITLASSGAVSTAGVSGSPYAITASAATGTGLGNYDITYTPGLLTVTPKALTITATGPSKQYGTALTAGASTTNFTAGATGVGSEEVSGVTLTPNAAGLSATTAAGAAYVMTPSLATGEGGFVASNYNITYAPYNGSVTAKPLTITANNQSKTFGTDYTIAGSEFTTAGLVNGDVVTSATFASVGSAAAASVSGSPYSITVSNAVGTGLGNYTITYMPGSFTVGKKALTITANNQSKTYGSLFTFAGTEFTPAGLVNGNTVTSVTFVSSATPVTAVVSGTPYPIVPSAATGAGFDSNNYTITYVNGSFTVNPKALTVTANNQIKTYGTAFTIAGTEFTASGLVNGDVVSSASFASTGTAATANVAGSPYTITPSASIGTGLSNYTISYANGSLTVGAKSLTVQATGPSKVYGTALTTGTSSTNFTADATGVGSEVITSVTLTPDAAGLSATTAAGAAYHVTPSQAGGTGGFLATNYNISYVPFSGLVAKKTLTVSAAGINKTYDGSTTATVTLSNDKLFSDDISVAYTTATFVDKIVGTGKPVSVIGISISGAGAVNYVLGNTTASTTANITSRALTVSATGVNKTYDGNTTANITLSTDKVSGDVVNAANTTAVFADKNVGTGKAVSVSGISISGADASNYTFNTTTATTANITAKALTVSAAGINKTYDGNTTATVTLSTDKVSGDIVTPAYTGAVFADKIVATGKAVSVSGISISGTDAGNYTLGNTTASTTADITAKVLTVSAAGINKTYDGNTTASVTLSTDKASGDVVTPAYTGAVFANKNVGTGKAVSVSGISISGTDAGNYTFNTTAATSANITAKALTVSATGINKIYDGNTTASVILSTDKLSADVVTSAYTGAVFANKNVGTGKAVGVAGISISGADAGNYTFNTTAATTADITALSVVVTANTGQTKVYGASDPASFTYTLSPSLVTGDVITGGLGRTAGENAGDYAYTLGNLSAGANYSVSLAATPKFTIAPKAIVVTAVAGQTKVFGTADPSSFTYTFAPALQGADVISGAMGRLAGENAGTYAYSLGSLSAGPNYSLSVAATPTFSVTPKAIVVTATAGMTKFFGSADPTFTYTFAPALLGGDVISGALGRAAGENAGTYSYATGTLSAGANYSISVAATPTFTIVPKVIVVTGTAGQTKVFGSTNPSTYTYTFAPALVGADVITGLMGRVAGENTGSYAYTVGTLSAGANYSLSIASTPTYSITPKPIVITGVAGQTKVYGAADPGTFTYTFAPALEGSDIISGSLNRVAGENAGDYAYTMGTLTAGANYSLSLSATPKFTITPKAIAVTANSGQTKVYGTTDPALFTYTISPSLVGPDVLSGTLSRAAGENAGDYAFTMGSLTAGANYSLTLGATPKFSITPKPIVVTVSTGQTKVFGDNDPAPFTYTIAPDLLGGDVVSGAPGRVFGENVGNYAFTLGSLSAGANYSLSLGGSATMAITPKPIVITPASGQTKVYGASEPSFTYTFAPALIGSDVITGTLGRSSGENAGTYNFTLGTLTAGSNYNLSLTATTFGITPKAIVITGAAGQTKVYGSADPASYTYTLSPALVGSDVINGAMSRASGENVGDYGYTIGSLNAGSNYSLSVAATPKFSISAKGLTITGVNKSKCYNGAVYSGGYGVTYSGFVNGETSTVLGGTLSFSGTAIAAVNAGIYTIIPAGLTSSNYNIAYANGSLSINALPAPTISGLASVCAASTGTTYATETGMTGYTWTVSGGSITAGATTSTITVTWNTAGAQTVTVNYINANGCTATAATVKNVTVNPLPVNAGVITGSSNVYSGAQSIAYSVPVIANATTYVWTLPSGATIASGAGTNIITVNFGVVSGNISVTGNNSCGNGVASSLAITVTPPPAAAGTITGESSFGRGTTGSVFSVNPIDNATGYFWSLPPGATIVSGANTRSITVDFGPNAVSGTITVYGTNGSGNGAVSPQFAVTLQSAKFTIYPVPNDGYFTTRITSPVETSFNIRIFDQSGHKIYEVKDIPTVNGVCEKVIDLRPIASGIYYVEFINGQFKEVRKVLINRQ